MGLAAAGLCHRIEEEAIHRIANAETEDARGVGVFSNRPDDRLIVADIAVG